MNPLGNMSGSDWIFLAHAIALIAGVAIAIAAGVACRRYWVPSENAARRAFKIGRLKAQVKLSALTVFAVFVGLLLMNALQGHWWTYMVTESVLVAITYMLLILPIAAETRKPKRRSSSRLGPGIERIP